MNDSARKWISYLSPFVVGAFGLAGCSADGDDRGEGVGIGIELLASDETRSAIGVDAWEVGSSAPRSVDVIGRGTEGEIIARVHGSAGDTLVVEVVGTGHRLVIDPLQRTASDDFDANDLAVLDRFRRDAAAELGTLEFRDEGTCFDARGTPPGLEEVQGKIKEIASGAASHMSDMMPLMMMMGMGGTS